MKKNFMLVCIALLLAMSLIVSCDNSSKAPTVEKFTVTFDPNGGGQIYTVEVEKGKTLPEQEIPTREEYTFEGWFLGDEKYNFSKAVTSDIKLVAKWTWNGVVVNDESELRTAISNGGIIKLQNDIEVSSVIVINKDVKLDLNGKTIKSKTGTTIINNKVLTIKNGTVESTKNVAIGVGDNSTTTIESGKYIGLEGAVITGYATGATINIIDGEFKATDNAVIAGNGNKTNPDNGNITRENPNTINIYGGTFNGSIITDGYVACGIYAPWKDIVNVSGGTFNITKGAGIVARAGKVNVTGGTFKCTGDVTGKVGDSRVVVDCSALVFDSEANYPAITDDSKISVSGGTFKSDVDCIQFIKKSGDTQKRIVVSGGTFSSDPADFAEGYTVTQEDGVWTVK